MILCVGLNPVYQKTITIEKICFNSVNRADPNVLEGSAGKGINVARTIQTMGQESLVIGFPGGHTGNRIQTFLAQEQLRHDVVHGI
ncbi:hypothetical protein CSA56_10220 [candidate division KSB3 bacterium]|uniref:Carbohydrate kinase PfkB domain-containing protein n=1 Tax=candidate division KSB3 bacterium TaxID=2044937 RepID=A0A2G6KEQ5_9BACT|nr:MAG: hypothetical protein CSA56_10220 [candidate division KSB3 bacterium]